MWKRETCKLQTAGYLRLVYYHLLQNRYLVSSHPAHKMTLTVGGLATYRQWKYRVYFQLNMISALSLNKHFELGNNCKWCDESIVRGLHGSTPGKLFATKETMRKLWNPFFTGRLSNFKMHLPFVVITKIIYKSTLHNLLKVSQSVGSFISLICFHIFCQLSVI